MHVYIYFLLPFSFDFQLSSFIYRYFYSIKNLCKQILVQQPIPSMIFHTRLSEDAHRQGSSVGGEVNCPGRCNVFKEVVHGTLSGGAMLGKEAEEGNHGQASVLDLPQLKSIQRASNAIGGEVEGVENTTGVSRDTSSLELRLEAKERTGLTLASRLLHILQALQLREVESEELDHDQSRVGDGRRLNRCLASLIPSRDREDANMVQHIGEEHTSDTKHGPPAVLQLCIAVPGRKF